MILILFFIVFFSCISNMNVETSYYDNGKIRYEAEKNNNMLNGVSKYWSEEGILINEVEYLNDMKHGKWIIYYRNGRIKSITFYKLDKLDGAKTTYYKNGNKQSETIYSQGIQIVDTIRWDENGKLFE